MTRNPEMKRLDVLEVLARVLPDRGLITSKTGLKPYESDGFQYASRAPLAVALPETTEQVQALMRVCHEFGIHVVPRGVGTNLTGATVPVRDCITVATSRMRAIGHFDAVNGTVRVQAGVRNIAVSDHVRKSGWFYAPDPSSRKTCTIGGNIATNSGGGSCLRYGVTANHVVAVNIVLADGGQIETSAAECECEGLDITGLICGSEGQIGIVTEATLRLVPVLPDTLSMMLAFDGIADAFATSEALLAHGIVPGQLDFLDNAAVRMCEAFVPSGYPQSSGGLLLIQLDGLSAEIEAQSKIITELANRPIKIETVRDPEAADALWRGREKVYGAARRKNAYVILDGAVPLSRLPSVLREIYDAAGRAKLDVAIVGHAGDGTIHAFVFHDTGNRSHAQKAEDCADAIRTACARAGGTISSEYGIGLQKRGVMEAQFSLTDIDVQRRCVAALQRGRSLNPGKVFPGGRLAAE